MKVQFARLIDHLRCQPHLFTARVTPRQAIGLGNYFPLRGADFLALPARPAHTDGNDDDGGVTVTSTAPPCSGPPTCTIDHSTTGDRAADELQDYLAHIPSGCGIVMSRRWYRLVATDPGESRRKKELRKEKKQRRRARAGKRR